MPFVRVDGIIVNPVRCAERCPSIGAAREHHVRAIAAERADAGDHVNVVVSGTAGAVDSKEDLASKSAWIYRAAENEAAAHVDCRDLVKRRRDSRVLRVGRADTPKTATRIPAADKQVTVAGYVERSPLRRVRNTYRSLPCCSAIS